MIAISSFTDKSIAGKKDKIIDKNILDKNIRETIYFVEKNYCLQKYWIHSIRLMTDNLSNE